MMKQSQLSAYGQRSAPPEAFATLSETIFVSCMICPLPRLRDVNDTPQFCSSILLPISFGRSRPLGMCPVVHEMTA